MKNKWKFLLSQLVLFIFILWFGHMVNKSTTWLFPFTSVVILETLMSVFTYDFFKMDV